MKEIYKDIIDYENTYQISNLGNVKSLKRIVNGRNGKIKLKTKILKYSLVRGYKAVNIWKNGKYKNVKIHRLVGLYFVENKDNKKCINHINGIKTDNRVENLEWCTYSENLIHAYKNKLNKNEKIIMQFDLNNNLINEFESLSQASTFINKYNQRGNISDCCNKKRKTAYGFKWKYKF